MEDNITIKSDDCEIKNSEARDIRLEKRELSDYARFFDEGSPYWSNDAEYNLMYLKAEQRYATEALKNNGHLYLNDVYDRLGIPRTKAGRLIGWIYDENNPVGDNFVDFGIYDDRNAEFVNGYKNTVLLDFNVDGNIFEKIWS